MLSFIKEAAEYYLLFSGAILFLGAGSFSGTLMPFASRLAQRTLEILSKQQLVKTLVGKDVLNVNSIWRTDDSTEPQRSPPKKVQTLLSHVPMPVVASLKWSIATGHVALFSAFVAFGN